MAGEASSSRQKVKGTSYMVADKREMRNKQKGFPLIEPSALVRLTHYHKNMVGYSLSQEHRMGETVTMI